MRYRHYNPNPIKENASDCVIRMLTLVTGKSWGQAYLDLAEKGLALGDMPSSNYVWVSYLLDLGFKRYSLPNTCPDCYTIEDFAEEHPNGLFVVATGSHVCTVIDGFYYDSWPSGREIPVFYLRR
jgi:hypothetical protein